MYAMSYAEVLENLDTNLFAVYMCICICITMQITTILAIYIPAVDIYDFKSKRSNENGDKDTCGVCYVKNHDKITFVPCGHCNVCQACYDNLAKNECPFCRVAITQTIKLKGLD